MSVPGQRQYHLWEECPVAIAFHNNAIHLQYPSPYPSLHLWPALSSPRTIFFHPEVVAQMTQGTCQWQVGHFRLHYLLAGHSSTAFRRQNGEILRVVLISAILISFSCAIGGCFSIESKEKQQATIRRFCNRITVLQCCALSAHIFIQLHRIYND